MKSFQLFSSKAEQFNITAGVWIAVNIINDFSLGQLISDSCIELTQTKSVYK